MDSTEILARASYHRVSEKLADRHPYYPEEKANVDNFSRSIHKDQVARAHGSRACPKLVAVLNCTDLGGENDGENERKKLNATLLLIDFVKDQRNQAIAVENNVIECCAKLLYIGNDALHGATSKILASLAKLRIGRMRIANLDTIVQREGNFLLDSGASQYTKECATEFLVNLAAFQDGVEQILSTGTFESILSAFAAGNSSLLNCLAEVTRTEAGARMLLNMGCIPHVVQIMETSSTCSSEMVGTAANVIVNLSIEHNGKLGCIKNNAIAALASGLNCHCESVRRACIAALRLLSIAIEGKQMFCSSVIASTLLDALVGESPLVCEETAATIREVCKLPKAIETFVPLLASDSRDCPEGAMESKEVEQHQSTPVPTPLLEYVFGSDPIVIPSLLDIISGSFETKFHDIELAPSAAAASAERVAWYVATAEGRGKVVGHSCPTPMILKGLVVRSDDDSCFESCKVVLQELTRTSLGQRKEARRFVNSAEFQDLLGSMQSDRARQRVIDAIETCIGGFEQ